jgi:hypothetical protein
MMETPRGEIVIYRAEDGETGLQVRLEQDTVWLSLNQIAELFQRDKSVISRHLRNVFQREELREEATVAKFATAQNESGREVVRQIEYFNLDAILSVGYRVNSKRGTQFRIWATSVLRAYPRCGVSAAYARAALMSSGVSWGYASSISSGVMSSARLPTIMATGILVPFMHGSPW